MRVESEAIHGEALGRRLRNPGTRYDDIIVDTGAGDRIEMAAAPAPADRAIAPLEPSGVDVATMGLVDGRVAPTREHNHGLVNTAHYYNVTLHEGVTAGMWCCEEEGYSACALPCGRSRSDPQRYL